jgi:hypothetical protein
VNPGDHLRALDDLLSEYRGLWHPQPFKEARPGWCSRWPALTEHLLGLPDDEAIELNGDGGMALRLLARHEPALADLAGILEVPPIQVRTSAARAAHWAWEIPGRKRQQIEAFAAATASTGDPVLDWCGGKGHLGRLLALDWRVPVTTLELDARLCADGEALARRAGVSQRFVAEDALGASVLSADGQHAVALHACGNLHRELVRRGAEQGVQRLDIAPCCYHLGVAGDYVPFSPGPGLRLTRDDLRLAVTETVTAAPREARQRDRELAWKLAFCEWRQLLGNTGPYRSFKPVPAAWMRGSFPGFLEAICRREELPMPSAADAERCERQGWLRRRETVRLSIVRHAFRRGLELWLVLDLATYLDKAGYAVSLGTFCDRRLTPRNLMLSAQLH